MAKRFVFTGDRAAVRDRAVTAALGLVRLVLLGREGERLLWEQR